MNKMNRCLIFLVVIFCCLNALGQTVKKTAGETTKIQSRPKAKIKAFAIPPITSEEYEIYIVAVGKNKENFVVRDKSNIDETGKNTKTPYIKEAFKELADETLEDFKVKNKERAKLEEKFPTQNSYTLITDEDLKKIYVYQNESELDWEGFYKKHPKSGGIFTFSRVGFSKDGKQALLFVTNWCGRLCGTGNYYFLKKENEEWKVASELMIWIS